MGITKRALSHAKQIQKAIFDKVEDSEESVIRKVQRIRESYERHIPRIEQVINQTYPIRKGKKAKPVEFGQIYKIQESDGGIIADWQNYSSQPSDTHLFIPSIDKHEEIFSKVPHLAGADRGFWSETNETCAIEEKGVKRVCIPKRGRKSKDRVIFERQRWFRAGQRFRTGSEATISILKRRFGLNRCMDREQSGMNSWVALGCITRNLCIIAHQVT